MTALVLVAVTVGGLGFVAGCLFEHLRAGGSHDLAGQVRDLRRAVRLHRDQALHAHFTGGRWEW